MKIITGYTNNLGSSILTDITYENDQQINIFYVNVILNAWYEEGKKLNTTSLLLSMKLEDERDKMKYSQSFKECTIKVSVFDEKVKRKVMVKEIIDSGFEDEKLNGYIEANKIPIEYHDDKLGVFTLYKDFKVFVSEVTWGKSSIKLKIDTQDKKILKKIIKTYTFIIEEYEKWDKKIKKYTCDSLLIIKNESWLDEDDFEDKYDNEDIEVEDQKVEQLREFTEEDFISRIKITSLCISEDGSLDIWLDDGNIFFGHSINVLGKSDGTFTSAVFHG